MDANGIAPDVVIGRQSLSGECEDVDTTVRMSNPFDLLCTFLRRKGFHPEIVVAPYAKSPTGVRVVSISAHGSGRDWIKAFFDDPEMPTALAHYCDYSVENSGKMLVISPQKFNRCPDGSLSSLTTQFGSLMSLARDCNWNVTHAFPRARSKRAARPAATTTEFD